MARQKKPVHRVQMTEGKRNIMKRCIRNSIYRSVCKQSFPMRTYIPILRENR